MWPNPREPKCLRRKVFLSLGDRLCFVRRFDMIKVWEKPELVVLVRGRLEERVLVNCKIAVRGVSGPNTLRPRCVSVVSPCHNLGAT